jgi:hypothetical protein
VRFGLIFLFTVLWLLGKSQQPPIVMQIDTSKQSKEYWTKWASDLLDMSVEQKKDSLYIRKDVLLSFKDPALRKSVYPDKYDWQGAIALMKGMELKKAFWQLINIYMEDSSSRSRVMGVFILYDSVLEMDKVLLNAFYTYAFADPRVSRIQNGKAEIIRPDLLEKHLEVTKEIINYIWYNRKMKTRIKND